MLELYAWSALSFLMGATVYYELQRYGDFLYHQQQSLLGRFPMDTTHYSRVVCNDLAAPDQGSTAETEKSCIDHDSAQNGCLPSLTSCLKILFSNYYGVFLWEDEISKMPENPVSKHQMTNTSVSREARSNVLQSKMCMLEDKNSYWSKRQYFLNIISDKKSSKIQDAIKYPIAVASSSNFFRMNWEWCFLFGSIFSGILGVAVVVRMFLRCCGLICHQKPPLIPGKSENGVFIPVETLQLFKHNFELVVQHKNIHFKRAQQYYRTGLRVNLEKNTLSAENKALKREISCLKAKLTNQRFYIEMLEKMTSNDIDIGDIDCSIKIDDKHVKSDRVDSKLSALMDYVPSEESQSTLVEEEELSYTTCTDEYQSCTALIGESRLVEENISEIMKLNCPKVRRKEHLVEEESLQIRQQVCPNISEIIDLEKRLNQVVTKGKLPLSSVLCLSPKTHSQPVQDLLCKLTGSSKPVPSSRSYTKSKATLSAGDTPGMQCQSFSADDMKKEASNTSRHINRSFNFRC